MQPQVETRVHSPVVDLERITLERITLEKITLAATNSHKRVWPANGFGSTSTYEHNNINSTIKLTVLTMLLTKYIVISIINTNMNERECK